MNILAKTNKAELAMATTMLQQTAERIFEKGKDATGSLIGLSKYGGDYSPSYLAKRKKTGKEVGKVILQYKGDMANDWHVVPGSEGVGLGFLNPTHIERSELLEDLYSKDIFKHTKDEKELVQKSFEKEVRKILQ